MTGAETVAEPALVGSGRPVPILPDGEAPYCNLDSAASTPPLVAVSTAINSFEHWYSSVHRGAGFKSQVASAAYDGARESIASFVGARPDDAVVITRHTTDAINLLSRCLPAGTEVLAFAFEHHANLLPWRGGSLRQLPIPSSPDEMLTSLQLALRSRPAGLVSVTGASNVTGELPPLKEIADICRRHGARVMVDAAQLAPHRPIDMAGDGIDYLAFSGHKLYAPYGAGALVGKSDWLDRGAPYLAGGGAIEFVDLEDVLWKVGPDRHEAGSPNVLGAVALAVSCDTLAQIGMERIARHDEELWAYALHRLKEVPRLRLYSTWSLEHPHIGVTTFNLGSLHHSLVGAALSAEHGIGVRDGRLCAHPLMLHLFDVGGDEAAQIRSEIRAGSWAHVPGAVRASFGLDTTTEDVDRLVNALLEIGSNGPRWTYRLDRAGASYFPDPDTRAWPEIPGVRFSR